MRIITSFIGHFDTSKHQQNTYKLGVWSGRWVVYLRSTTGWCVFELLFELEKQQHSLNNKIVPKIKLT